MSTFAVTEFDNKVGELHPIEVEFDAGIQAKGYLPELSGQRKSEAGSIRT